ncbi:hypothetical protein E2C01_008351 [Portunus trituberculatus]|uniref:Uncharacterized protein n=1 Tax=Portunus trituberculatus TaxID=210409 RepID=A0A5B7D3P6_PORTR|nr:hypothetical protein [Portunus trituberculatus]
MGWMGCDPSTKGWSGDAGWLGAGCPTSSIISWARVGAMRARMQASIQDIQATRNENATYAPKILTNILVNNNTIDNNNINNNTITFTVCSSFEFIRVLPQTLLPDSTGTFFVSPGTAPSTRSVPRTPSHLE